MKYITRNDFQNIVRGAELLGTGGGGTVRSAQRALKGKIGSIQLITIGDLKKNDIVCTVFGVGASDNSDPVSSTSAALDIFQKIYGKPISAIVPVEIGAESVAVAIRIAVSLKIPLVDSDIVGMRSSPEVFLETISIPNLERTPCVISDGKRNNAVLYSANDYIVLEKILRSFAVSVGGDAFVAGYPLTAEQLTNVIPDGSITIAFENGKLLKELKDRKLSLEDFCKKASWKLFGTGKIVTAEKDSSSGFALGKYGISSGKDLYTVLFKNENLVLLKNREVLVTCPDSISLLSLGESKGINNFEENRGKTVAILGKKAIKIWRTKKGRKLFSPRSLGFDVEQKLLE